MDDASTSPKRILTFLPLPYHGVAGDWHRDVGLVTMELRRLGHDASMVMLKSEVPVVAGEPVVIATREEVESAEFWQSLKPWGIISNTWAAGRFESVWDAMRQATPRVIDRLDTDGLRSHRIDPVLYWHDRWSRYHDFKKRRWRRWISVILPLGSMVGHQLMPSLLERPQANAFTSLPAISAESPMARERIARFLRIFGKPDMNVHHVPHPVEETDLLPIESLGAKENRVVSIGRWDAHQKNFPMMLRIISEFLCNHSDWHATLIGGFPDGMQRAMADIDPCVAGRLRMTGRVSHGEIAGILARSKIFLMSSRHESFSISAAEALCSGCSVAAPPHIASASWFCGSDSGTVASRYSRAALLDALEVERTSWQRARRQPMEIARTWRDRTGANAVATRFFEILSVIPE